jgi:hypothetical protein
MATRPMSNRFGASDDDKQICGNPRCDVCWLWPRAGESKAAWLARLRARPTPRYLRVLRTYKS